MVLFLALRVVEFYCLPIWLQLAVIWLLQELLQVLAEGLINRDIAARLVLEESTIRTHLRNIYRKLGVNSRLQAIQRAREIGLL